MPSEVIAIVSTLIGAVVAGVISYVAGRGMKTHEWKLALAREEIASRKSLVSSSKCNIGHKYMYLLCFQISACDFL